MTTRPTDNGFRVRKAHKSFRMSGHGLRPAGKHESINAQLTVAMKRHGAVAVLVG